MSIYNGFATRMQEETYNKSLYQLWFLLQLKVSYSVNNMVFDNEQLKNNFKKLYK